MANLLVKVETSVPSSLDHRVVIVHDDGSGTFQWYIGDSNNDPVKITPNVADTPVESASIDDTDSPYTVTTNATRNVVLADATNGAVDVTLPPLADWADQYIIVKKFDSAANNVNINPDGSETIEGNSSISLTAQWGYRVLFSDGNQIVIVGSS